MQLRAARFAHILHFTGFSRRSVRGGKRMNMKDDYTEALPRYQQIALELAARIVEGNVPEGDKISGRSAIASQFGVSPETARRAFCILADLEIVSPEKGSGTRVLSKEKAAGFIAQFSNQKNLESIKADISRCIERQKKETAQMNGLLSELINATEHYRSMNPLAPYTVRVTASCRFLGKTIQDVRLWQNTGATLVAIRREDKLLLSPGPYASLRENDTLFFITQDLSDRKVSDFLFGIEK